MGIIGEIDEAVFAVHCDAVGKFEQVTREMQTITDMTDLTPQDYQVQSALFTVRNKLVDQIIKTGQEFGLSPSSRTKLKDVTLPPALPDGWDDL
jgi:P27 family predicted phage terminase small subunit